MQVIYFCLEWSLAKVLITVNHIIATHRHCETSRDKYRTVEIHEMDLDRMYHDAMPDKLNYRSDIKLELRVFGGMLLCYTTPKLEP